MSKLLVKFAIHLLEKYGGVVFKELGLNSVFYVRGIPFIVHRMSVMENYMEDARLHIECVELNSFLGGNNNGGDR